MESYNVSLSRKELELISICLSSCSAQCFYSGNNSLAVKYFELRGKINDVLNNHLDCLF